MAGRNLSAAGAMEEEGEHVRPPKIDVETLCLLYILLLMTIWMSSFRLRWPALVTYYIPAMEALVTCFFFAFVTVQLQVLLAIALSEKPEPSLLPPPVNQWTMALTVWLFGVLYYMIYASLSDGYAGYLGLIFAGVASVVSLAMTVYNMLQRPVFA
ncbi:hypothetical protein CFC21_022659 [Triticum aestivum]|uniref:Uncharacterized protein n=2 Tax=Triticum aestivum TaxID=4565 RepID=A0A9R1ECF9_WHEAT|nr:uncharacterized protein LOC123041060 isoform X3 [Triticum aestivum]KAF7007753.1 hypothetical protein CFC21_022659 [Triticum aestivum]